MKKAKKIEQKTEALRTQRHAFTLKNPNTNGQVSVQWYEGGDNCTLHAYYVGDYVYGLGHSSAATLTIDDLDLLIDELTDLYNDMAHDWNRRNG